MPRSRGSEMAQRRSPRTPTQLRTSSSDSDSSHHRQKSIDRSPKPSKLSARIVDLESQLGQAQAELKSLKHQLASAEAAKKAAQVQLENTTKTEPDRALEALPVSDNAVKSEELLKEIEKLSQENKSLSLVLNEKVLEASSAKAREEDKALELDRVLQELETTKSDAGRMKEKLDETEKANKELEEEMKKLRVQTEQWRKAADAAAAVLASGAEANQGRISEQCGSMDKQYNRTVFEPERGYGSYFGSPRLSGEGEEFGSGKRRSSGIKMFDLWKKKNPK